MGGGIFPPGAQLAFTVSETTMAGTDAVGGTGFEGDFDLSTWGEERLILVGGAVPAASEASVTGSSWRPWHSTDSGPAQSVCFALPREWALVINCRGYDRLRGYAAIGSSSMRVYLGSLSQIGGGGGGILEQAIRFGGDASNTTGISSAQNVAIPTLDTGERPREVLLSIYGDNATGPLGNGEGCHVRVTADGSDATAAGSMAHLPEGIYRIATGGATHLRVAKAALQTPEPSISILPLL